TAAPLPGRESLAVYGLPVLSSLVSVERSVRSAQNSSCAPCFRNDHSRWSMAEKARGSVSRAPTGGVSILELARSFERSLRAANTSQKAVETYLDSRPRSERSLTANTLPATVDAITREHVEGWIRRSDRTGAAVRARRRAVRHRAVGAPGHRSRTRRRRPGQ